MRWFYAAFNLFVVGGPLVGTLIWAREFWTRWRALLGVFALVSLPWIALDIASHASGWWSYNAQFISGIRLFELPIEEVLFFATVPFACLVVWHVVNRFSHAAVPVWLPRVVLAGVVVVSIALAAAATGAMRTLVDASITAFIAGILWRTPLIRRRSWLYWNGIILVLFIIFDTILTALPVVTYNASAMTGLFIGTVPVEDFLYNFSLLNMALLVFERASGSRKPLRAIAHQG